MDNGVVSMFSLYEYQQLDNSTIVKNGVKKIVSVVCILKLKFGLLFACMKILNGFFSLFKFMVLDLLGGDWRRRL